MVRHRIAFVVNNLNVGGLEKVVISLLRGLNRDCFDVHLICLDGAGKLFDQVEIAPECCLVLQKQLSRIGPFRIDLRAFCAIRSFIGKRGIQLIHAHNLGPLLYGGLAARSRICGPRVVYSEHNQIYSASGRTKSMFRHYLRLADQIVTVSKDLQTMLREQIGVLRPVAVLYNGIDGSRFRRSDSERLRHELGVSRETFLVGTAVVLSEQKGIRYLMEAAVKVVGSHPGIKFVVAGDGPLRCELEAHLVTLNLGDRFCFLGYRQDVPEVISALDLYVLPSLWEGLPLALMEALAIGKPIVCSRVGGNPEIVEDGENGYLVAPRDIEDLAAKILTVARDKAFVSAVQPRNREKFERNFSERAMVCGHETLYKGMLANRCSPI